MKKILVIDDEDTIRDTISVLLTSRGYEVVTAPDGLAGVKVARREQPDLVISDITMEPVDGFMTLSIIKQSPGTERIPFILVTGDRELESMRKGLVLGADDYITKPFTPAELLETVNAQLQRRETEVAAAANQVRKLQEQLAGPVDDGVAAALAEIRECGEQLAGMSDAGETARCIGEQIAETARGLRHAVVHAGLLTQIEAVAGSPDALAVLRRAVACDLQDVVEAECRQAAERHGRGEHLTLQLTPCRVAIGSAALSRMAEELADNAFAHSPPGAEVTVRARVMGQHLHLVFENRIQRRAPRTSTGEPGPEVRDVAGDFEEGLGFRFVQRLAQIHGGGLTLQAGTGDTMLAQLELPLVTNSPSAEV